MADLAGFEDWSLQAIVGGASSMAMVENQQKISMGILGKPQNNDQDFVFSFSDCFDQAYSKLMDEGLEAFYKPFYPAKDSIISSQNSLVEANISGSNKVKDESQEIIQEKKESDEMKSSNGTILASAYSPRYKRRKNQQKRVVTQVSAEGLSSDMWAWRKYGQKPIKGSPFPRSYYRCSSMKGCLARKQVEQSCTDPGMFIVTYTAEHCHTQPTRRNSLAGTVRQKFPTPKSPTSGNTNNILEKINDSIISNEGVSPKSILMESSEEEFERKVKLENCDEDEEQTIIEGGFNDDFCISDFLMNDDFFASLEDLDEPISGLALARE